MPLIVVMPDGGHAGWYSNPVSSNVGPRNWGQSTSPS
ncbi:esterase [Streptomyces tanashiensis]